MTKKILVINPNSNPAVTEGFSDAVAPLRLAGGPLIDCITLEEGPWGIESQEDADSVVLPLRDLMMARTDADAFVIACYSDPGIEICRRAVPKPVFGIQESGVFAALQRGQRFGVIALGPKSIERHLPYIQRLGIESRLAAERPLNLSVEESESENAFPRVLEVARELAEKDIADTLVLGCAGMARHRQKLENAIGLPVTDPTQAAVSQALGTILLA
ncbi:aspartate/glutamate racemase family protein [Labrenzia sp. CE80]|uniref:aspartate/glutamate racemase family protein n=1 Tax=Labrenzia sp. CE80 TaxID=1788986 RepID=UPI0018776920|nr:aspartate/glutamate racemase family protein [Labrenzia sp. CE80]